MVTEKIKIRREPNWSFFINATLVVNLRYISYCWYKTENSG